MPIIPHTIPAVAIPLLQTLLLATATNMIPKLPRIYAKQKNDTIPQTIPAIANPSPGFGGFTGPFTYGF